MVLFLPKCKSTTSLLSNRSSGLTIHVFLLAQNRKKTKLYSRLITGCMFLFVCIWVWEVADRIGVDEIQLPTGCGPWTGPWVTLVLCLPVKLQDPFLLVLRMSLELQMGTQRSWHPSCRFPQISLTPEAGKEKLPELRLMSLVPQRFRELPGASLKPKVTSPTEKWSKD